MLNSIGPDALRAILEPDLSAAMMFTLVMAVILFAAGARIGHFVFLGVLGIPVPGPVAIWWMRRTE